MTADRAAVAEQLEQAFAEVNYPIEDPLDLSTAFRSWDNTRFAVDDRSVRPAELQLALDDDYPYETVDEFVTALLDALEHVDEPVD